MKKKNSKLHDFCTKIILFQKIDITVYKITSKAREDTLGLECIISTQLRTDR